MKMRGEIVQQPHLWLYSVEECISEKEGKLYD